MPANMRTLWKEAATALLVRKGHFKQGIELLLLQRSSASKFMPGIRVFPGGKVSSADFSNDWSQLLTEHCKGSADDFGLHAVNQSTRDRPDMIRKSQFECSLISTNIGLRLCALRETFEESGILLCKYKTGLKQVNSSSLNEWRDRVHSDASQFLPMCEKFDVIPDVWSLYEWTNWLTPTQMGGGGNRRFDTMFYVAFVDNFVEAASDDKEVISSEVNVSLDISLSVCL